MEWWWSWLLMLIGVTGIYVAGRKNKAGWAIGLGAQLLWIAYALVTEQYGFIVSAFVYGYFYANNFWKWRKEEHAGRTSGD